MQLAMVGEKIVPIDDLPPVYFDRGTYFGDGVYEVLRTYDGRIFALEEHLERFRRSLHAIGIMSLDVDQVRERVLRAVQVAQIANARIYFHVTRGSATREHIWDVDLKPNFFLTVTEVPDSAQEKQQGIAVSTHPDWRWRRCDIKSLNLLANVLARQDATKKGCVEAILVDEAGLITEGSGSAVFALIDGILRTAPLTANILPSITRAFVIRAAQNLGLALKEESLTPEQAKSAQELFLAVTTKDIVPVVKFDEALIADGQPGKWTKALIAEFHKFT